MLDKNQPYDKIAGTIMTPHVKWANPYCKGKIKALVVAPAMAQRETIELAQRLSLDFTPLMTHSFAAMYHDAKWLPHAVPAETVDRMVQQKLKQTYAVILIGKVSWKILPDYLRTWIKEEVSQGTGLIYICPRDFEEMEALLVSDQTTGQGLRIIDTAPRESLPILQDLEEKSIITLSRYGKGKVATINYHEQDPGELYSLTPAGAYQNHALYYDYFHSIIAKTLLWAADKQANVHIQDMKNTGNGVVVKIANAGATKQTVLLELLARDESNHVEHRQERLVTLSRGKNELSFAIPPLKSGLHILDLWVKKQNKTMDWKSSARITAHTCSITKLVLDQESYKPSDTVNGKIELEQTEGKELQLAIRLIDNFDRVMAEQCFTPVAKELEFSFVIKNPLSLLLKIEAALSDGKQVFCDRKKEFTVVHNSIDDFFFALWVEVCDNHLGDLALQQFQTLGADFDYTQPTAQKYYQDAKANLKSIPYLSRNFFPGYGYSIMDQESLHRIPCFTDPDFRAGLKENLQQKAQLNKRFSHYYSLSINGGLSPLRCIMPLDLCFSPTCQAHFREYLKREYHSLEALNQEWGTACKSWEEVKAMTFPQARRHGNFAPWADHRMHMEQVFTDINRFARKAILEIDPEAVIGLDEPNATSSYNGYDWPSLMQELDFCNPYFGKWHWRDDQIEAARCFGQKLEAPTGIWFGSYWRGEEFNRFIPWQSLFNGMKGVYWWVGMASRNSSIGALTPDFAPLPYFAQALEEINEIKRGIGKLLLHCTRKHDKIAIHYSTRSIHAATIEANTQLPPEKFPEEEIIKDSMALPDTPTQFGSSYPLYRSQLALMTVLEDIGLQYDFVSPEQLENGEFQAQKYKVLVLPYAKALSPAEAEEIKAFVRNGGLLLADRLPGIMDGHCKHLPQSSLIDLFSQADQKLQVNCHGKGKAVCLHDFLDDYVFSLRRQGREKAKREKIKEFLQLAAVEPGARILDSKGDDLGSTEMVFFRNGAVEFVCLLRDYLSAGSASKEVTIMFPRLAHIYDVRTNQYLGFGNQAALTLRKGQARVFALSPYQVLGVNLALDKEKYRPGDSISVKIDLDTTDNAAAAHVFRIEVLDPEHQTVKHYSRNLLAENGSGAATLTLALNDARGIWTIQASEVMSGKTATKSWLVE